MMIPVYHGAMDQTDFEIFAICLPGFETLLAQELKEHGVAAPKVEAGGVTCRGDWPEVWRLNRVVRGATRILVRIGSFRAFHLAQLDKRAHKFDWAAFLRPDVDVSVETVTKASKIYHAGAATQRIAKAITDTCGAAVKTEATVAVKVRIDDNLVTISLDTSGAPLHKRGHKTHVGKAPMRETMAALFLRDMGFDGTQTVLDPMCGSGTFPIEAAEQASGLVAGRARSFAFEELATYDTAQDRASSMPPIIGPVRFYGSDRDAGAIANATANAEHAGVLDITEFRQCGVSEVRPPEGAVNGIVIVNPPYGARIGNKKLLYGIHGALGAQMKSHFRGWRVGIITSEPDLAYATGLPLSEKGPIIPHGGLKVRLYKTKPLG